MIKGKRNPIFEVTITEDMLIKAKKKSEEMGTLRNSITKGERNTLAFLGEEIVASVLKASESNTYDYDLIHKDKKIDVKSKNTTVTPKPDYEVSVAELNTKQKCDYYVFTRVSDDLSTGWILGYMEKEEYYKKARFLKKGEIDGSNSYEVKSDCWNMFISDLKPIKNLI